MINLKEITDFLEDFAPLSLQESYDNAGLIIGDKNAIIKKALLTIDITEEVLDEAIESGANLLVAHHPIIFSGLKKITGKNYVERCIIKAIKNDIAIYASHTNVDSIINGVNDKICKKIGLTDCKILQPISDGLRKLVTFIPVKSLEQVRIAIFEAGAGSIGKYDQCSFNVEGFGTFRAGEDTNPHVGEVGELHQEQEVRCEVIYPNYIEGKVIRALKNAHPYEEVVYDIYNLQNKNPQAGMGMIGNLLEPLKEKDFLQQLKDTFDVKCIRHTKLLNKKIAKVAVCGGAGSFLLHKAIAAKADIFVTGDFKYHQFFDAENKIVVADIGHFESEQFTKEIFYEQLTKKFPNFAVQFSEVNTNPVHYFIGNE